ncbi:MAG: heme ABC exporter ATP-binding protein CcmA [Caulobacterales bacterium]
MANARVLIETSPIAAAVGLNLGVDKEAEHFAPVRLSVEAVTLERGGHVLFERLSFSAAGGDFVELRGPNGAGKTSLLRAIAGFLKLTTGAITFEGVEDAQLALHLLGHRDGLKAALNVEAHARYWASLLGEGADAGAALDRVGLARIADLPARILSQGQSRRLALTRLVTAPRPVWLLDEPAAGLDTQGKDLLDALIAEHRARGGLVIAGLHERLTEEATMTVTL